MKFTILLIIKLYWKFIPESKRRSCLFAESCSRHVYRITKEQGFLAGIEVFKLRYKKCRKGYKIGYNSSEEAMELHLVDGSILKEEEISEMLKTK